MGRPICTFYNRTSHVLHCTTIGPILQLISTMNPETSYTWEVYIDPNATYREISISRRAEEGSATIRPVLSSDDYQEWEEIVFYTPDNEGYDTWVGTKSRQPKIYGQVISNPYVTKSTSILSAVCCTHDFTTI
jgi:hypothetical protein